MQALSPGLAPRGCPPPPKGRPFYFTPPVIVLFNHFQYTVMKSFHFFLKPSSHVIKAITEAVAGTGGIANRRLYATDCIYPGLNHVKITIYVYETIFLLLLCLCFLCHIDRPLTLRSGACKRFPRCTGRPRRAIPVLVLCCPVWRISPSYR